MSQRNGEPVMRVRYETAVGFTFVVDVRKCDLDRLLAKFPNEPARMKRLIMKSVKRSLDEAGRLALGGYVMTEEEMLDCCNDVGIWFAYEVYEGRATFVPTAEVGWKVEK